MTAFELSQLLIVITFGFDMLCFQFKQRHKILICLSLAGLLLSAHFALLQQWTPCWMSLIAAGRFSLSIFFNNHKLKWLFHALVITATALTYHGLVSVLACCGALIMTEGAFNKNDQKLRLFTMFYSFFAISVNVLVMSPAGIALEIFFLISNYIGYYRHYLRRRKGGKMTGEDAGNVLRAERK